MGTGVWTNNLKGLLRVNAYGLAWPGIATITNTAGTVLQGDVPVGSGSDGAYETHIVGALTGLAFYRDRVGGYYRDGSRNLLLRFGSGTSVPAATDVNLNQELAGLTRVAITNGTRTFNKETGVISRPVSLTVQNPSTTPAVIREWGIFSEATYSYNSANSETITYMLYRELLDSPVTLNQYESAKLELTVTLTLDLEEST